MTRSVCMISRATLSFALLFAATSCSSMDDGTSGTGEPDSAATDGISATQQNAFTRGSRHRRATPAPRAGSGSATGSGGSSSSDAGAASATGSPSTGAASASSRDPAAVAAAARTPDGRAIPQPAGPNGECPDVVVVFGFWSCLTLNEQCTFQSGGATTHCACMPTSGEGQMPSWVCE